MKKPIIGIVAKHYKKESGRLETFIRDEVEQAIFDNGGVAIGILPPNEDKIRAKNNWQDNLITTEKQNLYAQIALCDGIILQGGAFSDEYECFIAKYCYDYNIPILGICAGFHNLIKAVGGEKAFMENDFHDSNQKYVHSIKIKKDSKFYQIIKQEEIMVNSRHRGYCKNPGPLQIVAYAESIPEVVEDSGKKFYIGVQFHPESLYKKDNFINQIFVSFIETCSK